MFFFDPTFIIILPALFFSIIASMRVNSTFDRYSRVFNARHITAAEAARSVLNSKGLYNVRIERIHGKLTDHYDPRDNIIRLSDNVYDSTSAAAIGVACHEAGHAMQHAEGYAPIKLRQAIIPITNIGSQLGIWIFLLGIILASLSEVGTQFVWIAYVGIGLFSFTALFQLVTLPTEYNASSRAMESIRSCGILNYEEQDAAEKVLKAAALTYVAALAVSLSQVFRLLLILGNTRRRD